MKHLISQVQTVIQGMTVNTKCSRISPLEKLLGDLRILKELKKSTLGIHTLHDEDAVNYGYFEMLEPGGEKKVCFKTSFNGSFVLISTSD